MNSESDLVTTPITADLALGAIELEATELARIVAKRSAGDPNLHYLDGRELYGERFAELVFGPDRDLPAPEANGSGLRA